MSDSIPPANICRLILKLEGRLNSNSLYSAIQDSGFFEWLSNVRWSRPIPFMAPRWKVKGAKNKLLIAEHSAEEGEDSANYLLSEVSSRTVSPFKPPAFVFDLIHHRDNKTTLVFTWHHALMDARGAEMLISHIGRSNKIDVVDRLLSTRVLPTFRESFKMWLKLPSRANSARKAIHAVVKTSKPPMASIASGNSVKQGGPLFRVISFDLPETECIDNNCIAAGANFRSSLFYLAATIRAMHKLLEHRGCQPSAYVVPVPQDIRKKGGNGPVISNHVTILFYRAEPEDVATMKGLLKSLNEQMTDQIRNRTPESFITMMELFRNLPLSLFAFQVAGPTKGQIASFFFSSLGETCSDLQYFLDAPVKEVLHLPPVSFPPGLSIIYSRRNGRLSVVISLAQGCMSLDEIELFENSLRLELLNII